VIGAGIVVSLCVVDSALGIYFRWRGVPDLPEEPVAQCEAVVLLAIPAQASKLIKQINIWSDALVEAVENPLHYPASLGTVYCPHCWAALLIVHESDMMLDYVLSCEKLYPRGAAPDVWRVHTDCAMQGGSDLTVLAYHIREYTRWLEKAITRKFTHIDAKTTAGVSGCEAVANKVNLESHAGVNWADLMDEEGEDELLQAFGENSWAEQQAEEREQVQGVGWENKTASTSSTLRDGVRATSASANYNERYTQMMDNYHRLDGAIAENRTYNMGWADERELTTLEHDKRQLAVQLNAMQIDERKRVKRAKKAAKAAKSKEKQATQPSLECMCDYRASKQAQAFMHMKQLALDACGRNTDRFFARIGSEKLIDEWKMARDAVGVEHSDMLAAARLDHYAGVLNITRPKPGGVVVAGVAEGVVPRGFINPLLPTPRLEASGDFVPTSHNVVVSDDTGFKSISALDYLDFLTECSAKSVEAVERHMQVGEKMAKQTKKDSKRHKNDDAPKLESEMSGSKRIEFGSNAAFVLCGGQARNAAAFPVGSERTKNSGLVFVTHRHMFDGPSQQYVDVPFKLGQKVSVCLFIDRTRLVSSAFREGNVVAVVAIDGQDLQWVYTDIVPEGLSKYPVGKPQLGHSVKLVMGTFAQTTEGPVVFWNETMGKVVHVQRDYVYYDATTVKGDCGSPVYQQDGTVVASHVYGSQTYEPGKLANAGTRLVPPPLPSRGHYHVPPFTPLPFGPQAGAEGVALVGGMRAYLRPDLYRRTEALKYRALRFCSEGQRYRLNGLIPVHHYMKPSTRMNHLEVQKYGVPVQCAFDKDLYQKAMMAAILFDTEDPIRTPFAPPTQSLIRSVVAKMDLQKSAGPTAKGLNAAQYILELGGVDALAEKVLRLYNAILAGPACPEVDRQLLIDCTMFAVIGKEDGYKEKKLPVHDPPRHGPDHTSAFAGG